MLAGMDTRRHARWAVLVAYALAGLVACQSTPPPPREDPTPAPAAPAPAPAPPTAATGPHTLSVLLTTDEHGWLEPVPSDDGQRVVGGVVQLAHQWQDDHHVSAEHLILSGGDMWTGPYESTVSQGKPVVDAFNTLGYAAATIGNHEFDFGIRALEMRQSQAKFSFVAANILEEATERPPPWVTPFVVEERAGMRIGIVGLANIDTPSTTDRRHIVGLRFVPYQEALAQVLPEVDAAGVDTTVVLVHDRLSAVVPLVPLARQHNVHVMSAGHAHHAETHLDTGPDPSSVADDVLVCNAGAFLRSYCAIDLTFDGRTLTDHKMRLLPVERPAGDAAPAHDVLAGIIQKAHQVADKKGSEFLVRSVRPLARGEPLGQLVVDTWLEAFPYADAALTNKGGLRQSLPGGKVRVRDVASAMPFDNYLVVVDLTGKQLKEALRNPESVAGGVRFTYDENKTGTTILEVIDRHGAVIEDDRPLKVVINDFMYRGGDHYEFIRYDPEPEETAVDWRDPVMRYLRGLHAANGALDRTADDRAREVSPRR